MFLGGRGKKYGIDPYSGNVSCLLHMNGANAGTVFTDNSAAGLTITPTNFQTDTTSPIYGSASGRATGTSGQLAFSSSAGFTFGVADFTVEFWLKMNTIGTSDFFCTGVSLAATNFSFHYSAGGNIRVENNSTAIVSSAASPLSAGVWSHVALIRNGTNNKLFIDGTQSGVTTTDGTNWGVTGGSLIGPSTAGSNTIKTDQLMHDFRVTKGIARYTANFTPPVAELPNR